ncbi:MAG: hypothetical protein IPM83_15600 [Ignavibacteria bacterium]|nr:hypothetical protein [Ignavibacteria bacterium]
MIYATVVMLVGYVLFAYPAGNIASLFNTVERSAPTRARANDGPGILVHAVSQRAVALAAPDR